MKIAFSTSTPDDIEKQQQALSNIIVLCREESNCNVLIREGIIEKLKNLIVQSIDNEIKVICVRVLCSLTKDSKEKVRFFTIKPLF